MRVVRLLLLVLSLLALPRAAAAQYFHTAAGTSPTLTCSNTTSSTTYSTDAFSETLTASTTYTLPASAIGCEDRDHVELRVLQATGSSFTVTVNAGTGTQLKVPSNGGATLQLPTGTGSALHQIWVYHATYPTTPAWELVTQETVPAQGTITLPGITSGSAVISVPSAAGTPAIVLPTVNTTGPTAQPGTSGMALVATTAGVQSYVAMPVAISWGPYAFGNTSAPDFVVGSQTDHLSPPYACHFTQLACANNFHATTCTTAPTFNIFQGSISNIGTALKCSSSVQTTVGTTTTQAESLVVPASTNFGVYMSVIGGTCLTDQFTVTADLVCP